MSNVLLCQGAYAKTPYFVKEACVHLYSVEELCYYVYNYAYVLDDGFVTDKLVEWIDKSLLLPKLAKSIDAIREKNNAFGNLVRILNNEIGYYTEEEWSNVLEDIDHNSRMSLDRRKKVRADGLLNGGRYVTALEEYENILSNITDKDPQLMAGIYHNLGVCAAQMFMFDNAADYFEKAYNCYANTESYQQMLCARKLAMNSTEYLNYLSEHKETYEDSLEVERKIEILKLTWGEQPAFKYFRELEQQKMESSSSYYDGIDRLADEIKERYRGYTNGIW